MRIPMMDFTNIAKLISSPECKNIAILTGAGVSVASGIPDFRSPGGMYDTLRPELITATEAQRALMRADPTYVVEKQMFMNNPFPYLEVRRPFILGTREQQWKATVAHRFAELLHVKTGKLRRVYTQNIDGLYRQCEQLPMSKLVEVHGTIGLVSCETCGNVADYDEFCDQVKSCIKDIYNTDDDAPERSTAICCEICGRPTVKPTTVLFGGNLPDTFFHCAEKDLPVIDLLIIAGTSLLVSPANSLVYRVSDDAKRIIVNMESIGKELGISYGRENNVRDYFAQGECEDIFIGLCKELGWMDELESLMNQSKLPEQSIQMIHKYQIRENVKK